MSYKFHIDPRAGVVFFIAGADFTPDEFIRCISEVVSHRDFVTGFSHLVDLRAIAGHFATGNDIRRRASIDKSLIAQLGEAKFAIVSSRDHVFGLSRMYEMLTDETGISARSFREMSKAREWLGLAPDDAAA